ncbi:MAG: Smr/MutS family protein [Massiliimalia sp.]
MGNLEIDIHGLTVSEAKKKLERTISTLPDRYSQITVIHGYQAGTSLQTMVRKNLKHRRIKRKILCLNPGETILLIDPQQKEKQKK